MCRVSFARVTLTNQNSRLRAPGGPQLESKVVVIKHSSALFFPSSLSTLLPNMHSASSQNYSLVYYYFFTNNLNVLWSESPRCLSFPILSPLFDGSQNFSVLKGVHVVSKPKQTEVAQSQTFDKTTFPAHGVNSRSATQLL